MLKCADTAGLLGLLFLRVYECQGLPAALSAARLCSVTKKHGSGWHVRLLSLGLARLLLVAHLWPPEPAWHAAVLGMQVLSNPELRERYDKHGEQALDVDFMDSAEFFTMLFGSDRCGPCGLVICCLPF